MLRVSERHVTCEDGSTAVVVVPHGDLDMASLAELHTALGRALRTAGDNPRVVLDFGAVESLHPVVLGVLLDARSRCRAASGCLWLTALTEDTHATLADTGVESLFDITADAETALVEVL